MNTMLLTLSLAFGPPATKDPPAKEPPSIIGNWMGESGVRGGKPSPPEGATMEFTKDGTMVLKERDKEIPGTYKIDAKKTPGELDISISTGGQNFSMPGIYKIDGDTLTICLTFGGERPTKFESPEGSATTLITLKREKKK